jgi:preprotein translocase subunit SecF
MRAIRRMFRGENNFNFVRAWRVGFVISGVLIVASLLALFTRGLEKGIDFEGGTAWEVPSSSLSISHARDVMRGFGQAEAKIQTVGKSALQVQSRSSSPEQTSQIRDALASAAHVSPNDVAITEVGPSWGTEISKKAVRALIFFFVAIAIYISWTLREWRMAVGAVLAVLHDIILSVGVYAVFHIEVTPATVIAFLTILGFSLYDTVVVYDKVRENTPKVSLSGRMTYTEMASLSMNQVIMRSINTSLTALVPVLSILVVGAWLMGATTLEEFGLALFVGLVAGTYSSIFIATPLVAWLKEREPQYRAVREKLGRRAGEYNVQLRHEAAPVAAPSAGRPGREPVGAGASSGAVSSSTPAGSSSAGRGSRPLPPGYTASHPPRPRKKGRR